VKQELLQHGVVPRGVRRQHAVDRDLGEEGHERQRPARPDSPAGRDPRPQGEPERRAAGTVVEAQLDPGKGPVATVLVQNGTLKVGDDFICGMFSGRVRALLDERGKRSSQAGPAIPVQILGFTGVPMAGDQLLVVEDAPRARSRAAPRAPRSRGEEPARHARRRHARRLHGAVDAAGRARSTSSSRPTRAVRPKRWPIHSLVCRRRKCGSK
jgi:hypothetical protein